MLAVSPVFGFLNYFLRMSNVGMVMHAVTLTREEEPRVRSKDATTSPLFVISCSLIGRGNRSSIRFARAAKQDDAEQERNNEWDRGDSNNETGIGVPWLGESTRIGKVQTPDHEQQQRDQTNDHKRA